MDPEPRPRASALAPLGSPIFRAIWLASLVSNFGGLVQAVGAAWMMTTITSSANMVALVQASTTLPIMVFSLAAGAIADNFNRRRVMLVAQGFMLCVSVALTVAAWMGVLTPWTLLGFTFLIGCGTALNNPAWQASVGDMVPRADIAAAVALNSVGFNMTRSVGPAIGGLIVAAAGAAAAFAVNSLSYIGLIGVLYAWRPDLPPRTLPRERLASAMAAGLRYVAMSPTILKVVLRAFLFGLTAVSVTALLPLVARNMEQGGPLVYGGLLGAFGVGAIGGAFIGGRLRYLLSSEWIVRLGFVGFAVCATVLALARGPWLAGLGMMVGGACWVLALALFNTTVQLSTPRWVVGRALSLYQTAAFGGMALGSWLWGMVAESNGAAEALLWAAAAMIAAGAAGFYLPLPARAELDLDPLNRWSEPKVQLPLTPRSGPIKINVEYVIDEADVPEFLDLMAERQRIRRRDGARAWTLARDLEDPRIWVESYQTPTWVEYVRHNMRRTKADAGPSDRLRELHRGNGPPAVERRIVRQASRLGVEPHPKAPIDHP
ncbi:MFS transporter [Amaricoccus sp.]|uniref:MFS transporter n=1 Tax=Amaricoccus sp. TaxID=1872485 RepID=UPI0026132C9D|nr:MFS transporter [Amaricoccus sp.]HRO12369.1 MFS transporter [Amaricoccus sp.]